MPRRLGWYHPGGTCPYVGAEECANASWAGIIPKDGLGMTSRELVSESYGADGWVLLAGPRDEPGGIRQLVTCKWSDPASARSVRFMLEPEAGIFAAVRMLRFGPDVLPLAFGAVRDHVVRVEIYDDPFVGSPRWEFTEANNHVRAVDESLTVFAGPMQVAAPGLPGQQRFDVRAVDSTGSVVATCGLVIDREDDDLQEVASGDEHGGWSIRAGVNGDQETIEFRRAGGHGSGTGPLRRPSPVELAHGALIHEGLQDPMLAAVFAVAPNVHRVGVRLGDGRLIQGRIYRTGVLAYSVGVVFTPLTRPVEAVEGETDEGGFASSGGQLEEVRCATLDVWRRPKRRRRSE